MGFINLEKAYDRVNRESLWQALRMYDVGGKCLKAIKSMYAYSSACIIVKGGESEWFRIDSRMRRVYHIPLAVQCIYGWSDEGGE